MRRRMIALAAATTAMAGLFLAPAPAASAAATSCYGSAKTINGTDDNGHWPPGGSTYSTSNCSDINVKITRTLDVQTCFAPSSGGYYCNGWRTVYANTWGLAATDVNDGTRFWLLFTSTDVHGVAAY
ncbi:hypothetical protein ACFWVC_37215 [Streptomyces sp. NPDC058691]|uniref:hypothetical protein n=1 Tax=Streptomyces sp. NPDC058691 TaxID=3346601 RepID=UPI0036525B94